MVPMSFQNQINQELRAFFAKKKQELSQKDKRIGTLIDQIADVTLRGGDRMRPYLCHLGYKLAGGVNPVLLKPVLLALELTQILSPFTKRMVRPSSCL